MTKYFTYWFLSLCIPAFSLAVKLSPPENILCVVQLSELCPSGTELLEDKLGRCACFSPRDYVNAGVCKLVPINCDEEDGKVFTRLYRTAYSMKFFIGCGCYAIKNLSQF